MLLLLGYLRVTWTDYRKRKEQPSQFEGISHLRLASTASRHGVDIIGGRDDHARVTVLAQYLP